MNRSVNEKLVIIPTYNEIENINLIIPAVLELEGDFHVLIVDDDSPDGTAEEVKNWQLKHPTKVHMLQRGKANLASALPISRDLNLHWTKGMNTYSKWMQTSHIILKIYLDYIRLVKMAQISQ